MLKFGACLPGSNIISTNTKVKVLHIALISDPKFFLISQKLRNQISTLEAVICVLAAQIANVGESLIGAALQDKEGFGWVSLILILNISLHLFKSQAFVIFIVLSH